VSTRRLCSEDLESLSFSIWFVILTVSGWGHCRDAVSVVKVRGNKSEKSDGQPQQPTILYLSVAVCGTETTDAAFRLVARFYSLGGPLQIEEISQKVRLKRPQLVEIVSDREFASIPYSFSGWSSGSVEPRIFDESEGVGRESRRPPFKVEMWEDATVLKRAALEGGRRKKI